MTIVVFGLAISSSWGNGHATLWRGLCRALRALGHDVIFWERDVPYYAAHRDLADPPFCTLRLYADLARETDRARRDVARADVAIVTSYCPDAELATELVLEAPHALRLFYDLDTPVTLAAIDAGDAVPYLPSAGLGAFDRVLSYTGGRALDLLEERLGARGATPLYGFVDPEVHAPVENRGEPIADLSYLGTYAIDRQAALDALLLEPARRLPDRRFVIGGALYPQAFPWTPNVWFKRHVAPADHPAFYAASALTLNVTRGAMAALGWCPSGRLFEAAACGAPILSDAWEGLDRFFTPGEEILVAETPEEAVAYLREPEGLADVGSAARARVLAEHTAARRAEELLALLSEAR